MSTSNLEIETVAPAVIEQVRAVGRDISGYPVERVVADGGEPLRCCLRNAQRGDVCILFGYEPPLPAASPYRETGAVYAHAEPCSGWSGEDVYPLDFYGRPQVLRAYDRRGWIHPATTLHDGSDPIGALANILDDPEVVEVHRRNIAYGCYMFTVRHRQGAA